MIFITADTHGDIDHFNSKKIKQIKKGDTVIVLGDFGFIWNNSKEELKTLKKLSKFPFKLLFIDGINENFNILDSYPDTVYNNAQAKEIVENKIYYIKRGEVLNIENRNILCFGGGENDDMDFSNENFAPTQQDFDNCKANLKKVNHKVDYILTYNSSGVIKRFLNLDSQFSNNQSAFFDEISKNTEYTCWYFGSHHLDKYISQKAQAVYSEFYKLI